MKARVVTVSIVALFLIFGLVRSAPSHEVDADGNNLAEIAVSHADSTISASAAATPYLLADSWRVAAYCQNTGTTNTVRVGDSKTDATHGTVLYPAGATTPTSPNAIWIDDTDTVYAYSASGTTLNCQEIVRTSAPNGVHVKASAVPTATPSPSPTPSPTPTP